MAKNNNSVLLGYLDEAITEKQKNQENFAVNKVGGTANFPYGLTALDKNPICRLCGLPSRLIVQIYVPLENSTFHRTLYLFACINSVCWNKSESWRCFRVQSKKEDPVEVEETNACAPKVSIDVWCDDADDWGDEDSNANIGEENCNVIDDHAEKTSEDEESSSTEESMRLGFVGLSVDDDKNANIGAQGGAVGCLHSPMATAEIEGDEGEVVTVDPPTLPNTNLSALLQEAPSLPDSNVGVREATPFVSYFMSVWPEEEERISDYPDVFDKHVKDLLADYQRRDVDFLRMDQNQGRASSQGDMDMAVEGYEKSRPLHGDKTFHHFLTRIKENPEQILRYNREGAPLFLYPLQEALQRCQYCQEEMIFEFQLVPTIISKLRLECDSEHSCRLDFGTVLVYSCKKSCWSVQDIIKEELVVLQKESY